MAASATFALKAGVWFRRGRLLMVSPGSRRTACPLSGRNSTYRPVQISGTGSLRHQVERGDICVRLEGCVEENVLDANNMGSGANLAAISPQGGPNPLQAGR